MMITQIIACNGLSDRVRAAQRKVHWRAKELNEEYRHDQIAYCMLCITIPLSWIEGGERIAPISDDCIIVLSCHFLRKIR